jgi:hypothetical protein
MKLDLYPGVADYFHFCTASDATRKRSPSARASTIEQVQVGAEWPKLKLNKENSRYPPGRPVTATTVFLGHSAQVVK